MRAIMTAVLIAAVACLAGCAEWQTPSQSTAGLEQENRAQADRIVKLEDELASAKSERDRAKNALNVDKKSPGVDKMFHFEAQKVEFGFLTAAVNFDSEGKVTDHKFDNGIAAYVSVYDQFDSSLKVAGAFRLDLLDLARPDRFVIQTWTFEPEAAAKCWQRFPASYQFKLPLSADVTARKVMLKATFSRPGKPDLTATQELEISRP